jgi:hypothetical protein
MRFLCFIKAGIPSILYSLAIRTYSHNSKEFPFRYNPLALTSIDVDVSLPGQATASIALADKPLLKGARE